MCGLTMRYGKVVLIDDWQHQTLRHPKRFCSRLISCPVCTCIPLILWDDLQVMSCRLILNPSSIHNYVSFPLGQLMVGFLHFYDYIMSVAAMA